jgi:hypothetical protein
VDPANRARQHHMRYLVTQNPPSVARCHMFFVYSVRFHYFVFQAFAHGKYLWSTGTILPHYIPLRMFLQESNVQTTEAESTPRMVANVTSSPFHSRILIACRFRLLLAGHNCRGILWMNSSLLARTHGHQSWFGIDCGPEVAIPRNCGSQRTIVLHSIKIGRVALANMGTSGENFEDPA